ncbi:hypothetical protein [Mesomycoplasma hyopneumoniae]|uniref:Uncharacterized protein n=1 Tax=Mesomycoplasma hyopneumoniae (strain J / ATCC 25934 / NCTC 10110) TaxID=262719 RepID=Q4A9T3_MESHJ|nr:hypothetical protein [Mesomycoplasma hyopneumoniae]AAZ44488.2 hypothetical protein MHJ_0402 [Mesomycoplasma hyopneumoniae J]
MPLVIYLEIKTYKNDNDEQKTEKLYENYNEYIKTNSDSNIKLTMVTCFVDIHKNVREKALYFSGAWSIYKLNSKLNDINPNQKDLHDIIKSNSILSLFEAFKLLIKMKENAHIFLKNMGIFAKNINFFAKI